MSFSGTVSQWSTRVWCYFCTKLPVLWGALYLSENMVTHVVTWLWAWLIWYTSCSCSWSDLCAVGRGIHGVYDVSSTRLCVSKVVKYKDIVEASLGVGILFLSRCQKEMYSVAFHRLLGVCQTLVLDLRTVSSGLGEDESCQQDLVPVCVHTFIWTGMTRFQTFLFSFAAN